MEDNNNNRQSSIGPPQPSNHNQQLGYALPPNLLRINADNNSKQRIVIYWVAFFSLIFLIALISIFGSLYAILVPPALLIKTNRTQLTNLNFCNPIAVSNTSKKLDCLNFSSTNPTVGLIVRNIVNLNQFVLIMANFQVNDASKPLQISQNVTITYYSLYSIPINATSKQLLISSKQYQGNLLFQISSKSAVSLRGPDQKLVGYSGYVGYSRDIQQQNYFITVKFTNTSQIIGITSVNINVNITSTQATVVNPNFTIFTIVIRICFFVSSLICAILYMIRYRKIPTNQRTVQQRFISYMSILLVMFNDPLYAATILKPNGFLSFVSVFFVVNFLIFLIYHWIIFFERIHYENGCRETSLVSWPKYLYIGILYILTITLYCIFVFYHFQNKPIIPSYDLSTGQFLGLQIFILILTLLAFVYIISLYVRIVCSIEQKLWRNQLFMYFSILFLVLVIVEIFYDGFQIFIYAGRLILVLFCSMNMYMYYMQYMYTITADELAKIAGSQLIVDNQQEAATVISCMEFDSVDLNFRQEYNTSANNLPHQKQPQHQQIDQNRYDLSFNDQDLQNKDDLQFHS